MFYVFNRCFLVGSEHKRKAVFKLLLPWRISGERVTADEFALCIKTQQLVSHVAHGAFRFCLGLLPAKTAESIELRLMTLGARITLHEVETLDRHVELRVVSVIKQHELAGARSKIEGLQTAETCDAVIDVDHVIVRLEIAKVRKESSRFRSASPLLSAWC